MAVKSRRGKSKGLPYRSNFKKRSMKKIKLWLGVIGLVASAYGIFGCSSMPLIANSKGNCPHVYGQSNQGHFNQR